MPTDITPPSLREARNFALRGVAWSLGFFGLLRLNWIEAHVVLPFTRVQAAVAVALFGTSALPIEVTLACSGADAIALCLGAVLAYPVDWRMRLAGAGAGAGLIVGLNIVRVGTLGQVAASPWWFDAFHVYIWPALLTLAIAGYVFAWMRLADRRHVQDKEDMAHERVSVDRSQMTRRFVVLTVAFVLLFTAAAPLYVESAGVLALAGFIARAAAGILGVVGVSAYASTNVLWTARGSFLVTQECISTPLLPVYLGAVCAVSPTWRRLVLAVLAAAPIFIVLGIMRLLVVALPGAVVASPLFLIHAFYQLLLAAMVVCLAARWRHGGSAAPHALAGITVAILCVRLLGPFYTRIVTYPIGAPIDDPQQAIAFLPTFQLGLYLALWVAAFAAVGWRRFLAGLAVLGVTQTAALFALQTLGSQSGLTPDVRDIRGWAVAAPLLIVAAVVNVARPSR